MTGHANSLTSSPDFVSRTALRSIACSIYNTNPASVLDFVVQRVHSETHGCPSRSLRFEDRLVEQLVQRKHRLKRVKKKHWSIDSTLEFQSNAYLCHL